MSVTATPTSTEPLPVLPRAVGVRSRRRRTVSVDVRGDAPDVLARILGLLLRRRCTVTRVDFVAADRHRPGRLVLAYEAPAAHADRTLEWLRALVDVLAVEPLDG